MNILKKNRTIPYVHPEGEESVINHSEVVTEIFNKKPSIIIRWGIFAEFVIILLIIVLCWIIKFPQTVDSAVTITTINPPADLKSRSEGIIDKIFVKDKQKVTKGQTIAIIYNTANYNDVFSVYKHIENDISENNFNFVHDSWLMQNYNLGDLQQTYEDFRNVCVAYKNYLDEGALPKKRDILQAQIKKSMDYRGQMVNQDILSKKDLYYERLNEFRYKELYKKGLISASEYQKEIQNLIQSEQANSQSKVAITSSDLSIIQIKQKIVELEIQDKDVDSEFKRKIKQSKQQLITAIKEWEYQYFLESPINGYVTYVTYWSENQTVTKGERIVTIVPQSNTKIIGRMLVSSINFGEVKLKQSVNVKLNGYPFMKYGILKGEIYSISSVPDDKNMYNIEIVFPKGLITTYNKKLNFIQKMDGTGQILTSNKRLLERIFEPIREILTRQ